MSCVNSIRVIPESITIKVGELYSDVYAEVCPYEAECKEVCWHSEDTSIATVNPSSGYIYGKGLGTTRVYAAATDGSGCRDYITVNVRETVPVESITLNHTTISVECDKQVSLTSTVKPSNASNKCISWMSSNNSVARVSEGIITGVSVGTATITATATDGSGKSASCNVRVTGDILISSITVTPDTKTIKVGESAFLHTIVCPPNATKQSVIWDSYNSVIASVNPTTGLVVAKHPGTTIIRATACDGSGVSGYCTVRVVPIDVEDIVVCPESLSLNVGESSCLEATVYPVNATNPNISWTSGDCNIADVDSNGCVTAKSAGTTYICANANDGSGVHGCCAVTVIKRSIRTNVSETLNIHSTAGEEGDVLGSVSNGVYVKLEEDTPQNWKWYKITALTSDGSLVTGWCDGEYLEEGFEGLTAVQTCYIRSNTYVDDSTLIYNPDNSEATIQEGKKIQLWESGTISPNDHSWYAVNYNGNKAFVTADDDSFDETTIWIALATHNIRNVRVKSNSGAFIKSYPLDDATNIGKFSYHSEISLADDRLTNGKWYYVYGKNSDDKWTYGWCSAEDLEEKIVFGDCIYNGEKNLSVREAASASGSFIVGVNYGRIIRILAHNISTDNNGPWHKVLYNDKIAYVIAGKNTDNFSDDIRWFSMACTDKNESFTYSDIARMKQNLIDCDNSIINKDSVNDMFEPLMLLGYEPAFVAGILANIQAEGDVGLFESSNYSSDIPYYLLYMNINYNYKNSYSGKKIYNLDVNKNNFTELDNLLEALTNKNWEDNDKKIGFGLGCLQWSFDRTYDLVQKYKEAKTATETITKTETIEGEKMMIQYEFSDKYPNIKKCWENECGEYLNTPLSAYRAGYDLCKWYIKPSDTNTKAIVRGHLAESIYAVMMQ